MIASWKLPAALGVALVLATGALVLERSNHATTRAQRDELDRRVVELQDKANGAIAVNQRLTQERTAYIQAQAQLKAMLANQEARARAQEETIRRTAAEATARDRERRARPDVPPPEEMTDALAEAARAMTP